MTSEIKAEQLKDMCVEALEQVKARDVRVLDVRDRTGVTDFMVVCSGTSNRHIRSLAGNVQVELKKSDIRPLGVEGERDAEWVLVDFGDVVVHVMLPEAREFYDIERLWTVAPVVGEADQPGE